MRAKNLLPVKVRRMLRILIQDLMHISMFGLTAPLPGTRIFVRPRSVMSYVDGFGRDKSGHIIGGDWDLNVKPLFNLKKTAIVKRKIDENCSWEEAGMYDFMIDMIEQYGQVDNCYGLDDIVARYEKLDNLIAYLRKGGRYLMSDEISDFREFEGVLIHIGRNGDPIFSGGGCHRMAITHCLNLNLIPAEIGVIHRFAFESGVWKSYLNGNAMACRI